MVRQSLRSILIPIEELGEHTIDPALSLSSPGFAKGLERLLENAITAQKRNIEAVYRGRNTFKPLKQRKIEGIMRHELGLLENMKHDLKLSVICSTNEISNIMDPDPTQSAQSALNESMEEGLMENESCRQIVSALLTELIDCVV